MLKFQTNWKERFGHFGKNWNVKIAVFIFHNRRAVGKICRMIVGNKTCDLSL